MTLRLAVLIVCLVITTAQCGASQLRPEMSAKPDSHTSGDASPDSRREAVRQGIRVTLEATPLSADGPQGTVLHEGELASIRLTLRDAVTGAPVTAMSPKVWIDLQKQFKGAKDGAPAVTCSDKVRGYLQGTLSFRPDVDLNSYYILSLNNDATIGVIDPIRGVAGYSQLLTMIPLTRPGEDWAFTPDEKILYVSMPKAGQLAVIDTERFTVLRNIDAGSSPFRIAIQPDGKYLWVGNNAAGPASGVTVLDAKSGRVAAWLPTGAGHHELAFSDDSAYAFVSNRDSGSVTVIDVQRLATVAELSTGSRPVSMAYSRLSKALYVAHEGDGSVTVVDGVSLKVQQRIALEPGLKALRLAPGERWGFVVNARTRQLAVFDVSGNSIVHCGEVGNEPEQIAFSKEFAYIRSKKTAEVTLIALANLGKGDSMTPLRISGGGNAPNESSIHSSPADTIVVTPEGNAVLIASPADGTIVYYMEGMGVPAGNFRTYGRVPRAVAIVNRQMRESSPGVYSASFRVPAGGRYDVAFLLDSPRLVHCFEFEAAANPVVSGLRAARPVEIDYPDRGRTLAKGVDAVLRFRLKDAVSGQPLSAVADFSVLASHNPTGDWRQSFLAVPAGDGLYELTFRPPRSGRYTLYFSIPSLQVKINQLQPLDLHVR